MDHASTRSTMTDTKTTEPFTENSKMSESSDEKLDRRPTEETPSATATATEPETAGRSYPVQPLTAGKLLVGLSWLYRLLPLLVFVAMVLGIVIGTYGPTVGH